MSYSIVSPRTLALFTISLLSACLAAAQATANIPAATPHTRPVPAAAEQEAAAVNSPAHQGIRIHGHWVLVLHDKDGTVIGRREFDNSLVTGGLVAGGDQVLALLLSGSAVIGDPGVVLVQGSYTYADLSRACLGGTSNSCFLFTTVNSPLNKQSAPSAPANQFQLLNPATQTGLAVSVTLSPLVTWNLTGNYTIPSGLTSVNLVQTMVPVCTAATAPVTMAFNAGGTTLAYAGSNLADGSGDIAPKACSGQQSSEALNYAIFTSTTVPTPLTTAAGQVITITVTISFS